MAAMFDKSLKMEERSAVERILQEACQGRYRIVNELSTVSQ